MQQALAQAVPPVVPIASPVASHLSPAMSSLSGDGFNDERMKNQRHTFAFLLIIAALMANYGTWTGQILAEPVEDAGIRNAVFLLCVTAFEGLYVLLNKTRLRLHFRFRRLALIFLVNLFVIAFFRPDVLGSLRHSAAVTLSLGIIFFLSSLLHSQSFERSILIYVISLTIVLTVCMIVHVVFVGPLVMLEHGTSTRLGGLFFYGEFGVMAGATGIMAIIGMALSRNTNRRAYYSLTLLAMLLFQVWSDTRSAMLGFVICFLILIFLLDPKHSRVIKWGLLVMVVSLGLLTYLYFTHVEAGQTATEDVDYRAVIWGLGLVGIAEAPLTGYGNFNFFQQHDYLSIVVPSFSDAHSAILGHAITFGLTSLALFLSIFYLIVRDVWKAADRRYRLLVSLGMYWFIAPFFWGVVYKISGGFIQIVFGVTVIGLLAHPGLFKRISADDPTNPSRGYRAVLRPH